MPDKAKETNLAVEGIPSTLLGRHALVLIAVTCSLVDLLMIVTAALGASLLRSGNLESGDLVLMITLPYLLAGVATGAWDVGCMRNAFCTVRRALLALAIAWAIMLAAAFALKVGHVYSRLVTGYALVLSVFFVTAWRITAYLLLVGRFTNVGRPLVVVLGDDAAAEKSYADEDINSVINVHARGWKPVMDDPDHLDEVAANLGVAERVLIDMSDDSERHGWIELIRMMGINAEIVAPDFLEIKPLGLAEWNGTSTIIVSRGPLTLHERFLKRALDLGVLILSLPVTVPLMLVLTMLVKRDSPGPAFFKQSRIGAKNRKFTVYKFRTMRDDMSDADGNRSASVNDSRFTRLGPFLRQTSLDELPQLLNVFKGEMSIVGPRPHAVGSRAEGDLFWDAVPDYWQRHAINPGITGLAQIRGYRGGAISKQDLENRVRSDIEYANSWSIGLDIKIMLQTLRVLVHPDAY